MKSTFLCRIAKPLSFLIRTWYVLLFWLTLFVILVVTDAHSIQLITPGWDQVLLILSFLLLTLSIFSWPVAYLLLFKIAISSISILVQSRYSIPVWLLLSIAMIYTTAHSVVLFEPTLDVGVFIFSLTFFSVSLIDRFLYKQISPYVIIDRFKGTLHMTLGFKGETPKELRQQLEHFIEMFVISLRSLPEGKTYTFKTHQSILDELLKHREFIYTSTGTGIVFEKTILLPTKAIFDKRIRRRFILKKENKYKVTV